MAHTPEGSLLPSLGPKYSEQPWCCLLKLSCSNLLDLMRALGPSTNFFFLLKLVSVTSVQKRFPHNITSTSSTRCVYH